MRRGERGRAEADLPGEAVPVENPAWAQLGLKGLGFPDFSDQAALLHSTSDENLGSKLAGLSTSGSAPETHIILVDRLRGILGDIVRVDVDLDGLASRVRLLRAGRHD